MPQQHVFGGNGGIGLELEHPMAVRALLREQRLRCVLDVLFQTVVEWTSERLLLRRLERLFRRTLPSWQFRDHFGGAVAGSDRTLNGSGEAGIVQSPARMRLRHRVAGAGRLASCAGVAEKVARRSRTIGQGGGPPGNAAVNPVIRATSFQIVLASSSRGPSMSRSPALMVTDSPAGQGEQPSTVPAHRGSAVAEQQIGWRSRKCG